MIARVMTRGILEVDKTTALLEYGDHTIGSSIEAPAVGQGLQPKLRYFPVQSSRSVGQADLNPRVPYSDDLQPSWSR